MTNLSEANLNNGAAVGPQGDGMDSPSSFPAYPTYKDSGVEWLGVVPENWALGSLKHLAWIRNGRDYKEVESPDGEYPVIGSGGQFANATRYLYDGESVLLGRKGTIDKPLYIHGRFWTVDTMFYTEVTAGASAKFLYYNALTIPFQYYSTSTALPSMTQGDLLNHPCAIPALEEQIQIARFLDHETARIDALIEDQQRLIELLKEKRQAVISHAVTKGLDPTVPMKDSGVEWLGEVPAHWYISNVKRVANIRYGIGEPPQYHPEGMPLIRATNVHAGKLFSQGLVFVDPAEIPARRIVWLEPGDIVVVRSGAYTGDSAIIPNEYGPCIAGFDMVLRCHSARPDFIQFALLSKYLKEGQLDLEKMRAAQPHLNAEELGACMLVLPGMEEQIRIVEFLQMRCAEFDILMTEADQAKSLLQERRSALVSAAVTGKIDVRGWQPPASARTPELVEEAV